MAHLNKREANATRADKGSNGSSFALDEKKVRKRTSSCIPILLTIGVPFSEESGLTTGTTQNTCRGNEIAQRTHGKEQGILRKPQAMLRPRPEPVSFSSKWRSSKVSCHLNIRNFGSICFAIQVRRWRSTQHLDESARLGSIQRLLIHGRLHDPDSHLEEVISSYIGLRPNQEAKVTRTDTIARGERTRATYQFRCAFE